MTLETKLKDYFKESGIQMKWFAEKLGMTKQHFYQVLGGHVPLPKKYWKNVIILTNGKITLSDLMKFHFREFEEIEIKTGTLVDRCELSLKCFE